MTRRTLPLLSVSWLVAASLSAAASPQANDCAGRLAQAIPTRPASALGGTAAMTDLRTLGGADRDAAIKQQLMAGNVPAFLRQLVPVTFSGKGGNGQIVEVTICVMSDYLAIGNDRDFVRTPMGLPTAAQVALRFGFLLPTTRMVDAIYAQAKVHLAPQPMPAGSAMVTTDYLMRHNQTVDNQLGAEAGLADELVAGQKKDLVLSNRLRSAPGKVAIYGWHRGNGQPIQPLSTVHQMGYADYSHGIRLVSATAFVDDKPVQLADILQDKALAPLVSSEGTIRDPEALLASVAN
jgi:hypothetical protein